MVPETLRLLEAHGWVDVGGTREELILKGICGAHMPVHTLWHLQWLSLLNTHLSISHRMGSQDKQKAWLPPLQVNTG